MNANSRSEDLWQVLHQATALLKEGGFAEAAPPLPSGTRAGAQAAGAPPSEGYDDLVLRYGEHLAFGTTWHQGEGPARPSALLLCESPLSEAAHGFVRSWFENPRVNIVVSEALFLQPLPTLSGDRPPYPALARDLCQLLQPKAILSLGAGPAQRLLGAPLSLDSLRGSDYRFDRWSIVTTLDPESFAGLDEGQKAPFKAQVWKDLQRLLGKLRYG